MGSNRQALTTWLAMALVLAGLTRPPTVEAQVGLTSGMAQVTLVARVAPRGSLEGVSRPREVGRDGDLKEFSTKVNVSVNTGYRLVVRRSGTSLQRLWVRTASGEFQELLADSSLAVVREPRGRSSEREVRYRAEKSAEVSDLLRFEIAIEPAL